MSDKAKIEVLIEQAALSRQDIMTLTDNIGKLTDNVGKVNDNLSKIVADVSMDTGAAIKAAIDHLP